MKILIPLTILVLSFIIYYFFADSPQTKALQQSSLEADTLESIEAKDLSAKNYIPVLAEIKMEHKKELHHTDKPYLTIEDLKQINQKYTNATRISQKSYNQEIFLRLKQRIDEVNAHYPYRNIVLNSPLYALLPTEDAKQEFKTFLAADFGLERETIEKEFSKQQTLWDWVRFLSP